MMVRIIPAGQWSFAEWSGWRFLGWVRQFGLKEWAIWITRTGTVSAGRRWRTVRKKGLRSCG